MANQRLYTALLLSLVVAGPLIAQGQQPVAQNWSGWAQCQITIQAPGYSHRETHLWTITGAGTRNANMEIYPTSWTVTGDGSLQRVNGPTTVSAQWTVNGALQNVTIGTTLHLNRITVQRWTNHGPARSALTGTEVTTINGVPRSRAVVLDVQQWAFPGIETGTTSTRATGSNTLSFDGLRGPMNPPSGAMGTAACTWDFARGASTATPPPVATTPTTPASGSVSGGVPSGSSTGTGAATGTGGAPGGAATGSTNAGGSSTVGTGNPTTTDLAISFFGGSDPSGLTVPSSWPANGTARYGLGVVNLGSSPADGARITVPASAGLTKTSVSCGGQQGAQSTNPTVAQIESGFAITTFPLGSFVTCQILATVTATAGSSVTAGVSIAPPGGVRDPNPGNDTSSQTLPIVPAPGSTSSTTAPVGGGGVSADLASGVSVRAVPPYVAPANGMVEYDISIWNSGPSAANGAMLKISASAGPSNWSNFVCFTSQGPAPVPCPSGIAAGTIQSGLAIPSLPPNTGFKVWFDAAVPGTVGSNLSVTATITTPAGVSDTNPGNNSNTLTFPIVSAPGSATASPAPGGGSSASSGSGSPGGTTAGVAASGGKLGAILSPPSATADLGVSLFVPVGLNGPVTVGGVTIGPFFFFRGQAQYIVGVVNSGPSAADGATITIPPSSTLTKTEIGCRGQQGAQVASPAVQEIQVTVAQIESGFVIPTFPAGSSVGCTIRALATGTPGSGATFTVNVAAPASVGDPNPGNNSFTTVPVPIRP